MFDMGIVERHTVNIATHWIGFQPVEIYLENWMWLMLIRYEFEGDSH